MKNYTILKAICNPFLVLWAEIRIKSMNHYDLFIDHSSSKIVEIIHRSIDKKYEVSSTLHRSVNYGQITETLYRIIKRKRERYRPLPDDHIKEIERKIINPLKRAAKGTLVFEVSKRGLTIEEIKEDQDKHNKWCESAWSEYD